MVKTSPTCVNMNTHRDVCGLREQIIFGQHTVFCMYERSTTFTAKLMVPFLKVQTTVKSLLVHLLFCTFTFVSNFRFGSAFFGSCESESEQSMIDLSSLALNLTLFLCPCQVRVQTLINAEYELAWTKDFYLFLRSVYFVPPVFLILRAWPSNVNIYPIIPIKLQVSGSVDIYGSYRVRTN